MTDRVWKLLQNMFLDFGTPSMRRVDDGEKRREGGGGKKECQIKWPLTSLPVNCLNAGPSGMPTAYDN